MNPLSIFRPAAPKTAAELRKAIGQAEVARREAEAELDKVGAQRADALLMGTDAQVDEIEARQAAVSRQLDRTAAALAELRRRLPIAEAAEHSAARTKAWTEIQGRYGPAAAAFARAADSALAAFEALVSIATEAEAGGFGHEAAAAFARPPAVSGGCLLNRELVERFKRECERIADAEAAAAKAKPSAKASPKPAAMVRTNSGVLVQPHGDVGVTATRPRGPISPPVVPRMTDTAGPASVNPAPVQRQPARPLLVVTDPPSAGKVAVRLLRSGVELAAGLGQSRAGDVITVDSATARSLVERGAADFVAADTTETQEIA